MSTTTTPKTLFPTGTKIKGSLSRENTKLAKLKKTEYTTRDELPAKLDGKFHLPVLKLNDPVFWESLPLEERKMFTDETAMETCLKKCCGVEDLKSACCTMDTDNMEHILGPVTDEWVNSITKILRKNGNLTVTRRDIVIDYEEGVEIARKFFNNHPVFLKETNYPILRIQIAGPRFICKFLNNDTGMCNIYQNRPDMCKRYLCQYVKSSFTVRTKDTPNRYVKIR